MDSARDTDKTTYGMEDKPACNSNLSTSPVAKNSPAFVKSPALCETPVRERRLLKICEDEICSPKVKSPSSGLPPANLPVLTTPPSRLKKIVIRNPFDETRKEKLHMPFISPSLFTKATSPSQNGENFYWSIDDLANLLPAEIDEFQLQNDQSCDEQTEQEVQKSISRFFESNSIVPSPWGTIETFKPLLVSDLSDTPVKSIRTELDTMATVLDFDDKDDDLLPVKKDAWTQTELTVPMEILSPFNSLHEQLQLVKDQSRGNEDNDTSIEKSSSAMPDDYLCSSPCYNLYKSLLSSTIHTPKSKIVRSFGTPLVHATVMSPIGLSPIVHSFQQASVNFEMSKNSMEIVHCTCGDMSCDSGISSAISQTEVSFPCILPKNIEEVLKPFQTFIQDQSEIEDVNLNSSLSRRRKLLFHENLDMSVSSINSLDNSCESL